MEKKGVVGSVMSSSCSKVWHGQVGVVHSWLTSDTTTTMTTTNDKNDTSNNNINNNHKHLFKERYCFRVTSMYMQGFEWEGTTCIVYLFKLWVITDRTRLVLTCRKF